MRFFRREPIIIFEEEDDQLAEGTELKPVGFWYDPSAAESSRFPNPKDFVDWNWDPRERRRVARYLAAGDLGMSYMGYSWCRFECGIDDRDMGTRDFTDGEYIWPEKYVHYVRKHGVKPPEEFIEHVRRRLAQRPIACLLAAIRAGVAKFMAARRKG